MRSDERRIRRLSSGDSLRLGLHLSPPPRPAVPVFWCEPVAGFGVAHQPLVAWQSAGLPRGFPLRDLQAAPDTAVARRFASQSLLFGAPSAVTDPQAHTARQWCALSSLHEVLHRGEAAPLDPGVESLLRDVRPVEWGCLTLERGAYGSERICVEDAFGALHRRTARPQQGPTPQPVRRFEDEGPGFPSAEGRFWEWAVAGRPALAPFLHPQVLLHQITDRPEDSRRADFVLAWNHSDGLRGKRGLAIEIHGDQKGDERPELEERAQRSKREALEEAGWMVLELSRREVLEGAGPGLRAWQALTSSTAVESEVHDTCELLDGCWTAAQVDLGLLHLLANGHWSEDHPRLNLQVPEDLLPLARRAAGAFLSLLRSTEVVWGIQREQSWIHPSMEFICTASGTDAGDGTRLEIDPSAPSWLDPADVLPSEHFTIRRCCLPHDVEPPACPVLGPHAAAVLDAALGNRPDPPTDDALLARRLQPLLRRVFAKHRFRDGQIRGIRAALRGEDTLILLPAGHGKSLIFQLASFLLPGATLVVEPLRALIDDQVLNLKESGVSRCAAIHRDNPLRSGLTDNALIYVAPERLYVKSFEDPLRRLVEDRGIDLLVVDEAHSISECGHSFRPAYLGFRHRLFDVVSRCDKDRHHPPTLCLTATAVPSVVKDVIALAGISTTPISLVDAFAREGLRCQVRRVPLEGGLDAMKEALLASIDPGRPPKTLVFCSSKGKWTKSRPRWFGVRGTVEVLSSSVSEGLVTYYHGDLAPKDKEKNAERFGSGANPIMIATCAFGTGIDIPDIRKTIHIGAPAGLEAWYQESGRAGRDGGGSWAVTLLDLEGAELIQLLTHAEGTTDALDELRRGMASLERKGSFTRQMQLLLGNPPQSDHAISPDAPAPRRTFLGSLPGWRFECSIYDSYLLDIMEEAGLFASPASRHFELSIPFHPDHDQLIWKAVHRLALLGIITKDYQRTFHVNRPNEFRVTVDTDRIRAGGEDLVEVVRDYILRMLGRSKALRFDEQVQDSASLASQLFDPDRRKAVLVGCALLAFTNYEAVRKIRIQSFLAMHEFFGLESDSERQSYLNAYLAREPWHHEILQRIRDDRLEFSDWSASALILDDLEDWPAIQGFLAQASAETLGSVLPDYLFLAQSLRLAPGDDRAEEVLRAVSLIAASRLPVPLLHAALADLHDRGGDRWLDILHSALRGGEGQYEAPKANASVLHWIAQLPESCGSHPTAHLAVSQLLATPSSR